MGNAAQKEIDKHKKDLKENKKEVNLYFIGESHRGKSTFGCGCFRVLTGKSHVWPVATGAKNVRTTSQVQLISNLWSLGSQDPEYSELIRGVTNINIFDAPGISIKTKIGKQALEALLKGVKVGVQFPIDEKDRSDKDSVDQDALKQDNLLEILKNAQDEKNKAHYVILFTDCEAIEQKVEGWLWSSSTVQSGAQSYFEQVVTVIESVTGNKPLLVCTKKDKATLTKEQVAGHFSNFSIPEEDIFLIQNYTAANQKQMIDTDALILRIINWATFRCK